MSICTLNDVSFYNDDRGGIPIASRIRVKDPRYYEILKSN